MSFRFQPAGKAGKFAGEADATMTRYQDRERIAAIRRPNRTRRFWIAELVRELTVGASLTKRNAKQCFPNLFLESSSLHVERYAEGISLSGEIFFELTLGANQNRMLRALDQLRESNPPGIVIFPKNGHQPFVASDQLELSYRGCNIFVRQRHGTHLTGSTLDVRIVCEN